MRTGTPQSPVPRASYLPQILLSKSWGRGKPRGLLARLKGRTMAAANGRSTHALETASSFICGRLARSKSGHRRDAMPSVFVIHGVGPVAQQDIEQHMAAVFGTVQCLNWDHRFPLAAGDHSSSGLSRCFSRTGRAAVASTSLGFNGLQIFPSAVWLVSFGSDRSPSLETSRHPENRGPHG
jgi:hypothetical protein